MHRSLEADAAENDESALVRLTDHLLDAGEIDEAAKASERAVDAFPASAEAASNAARAYGARYERDLTAADGLRAVAELRRAVELNPGDARAASELDELLAFAGVPADATSDDEEAAFSDCESADAPSAAWCAARVAPGASTESNEAAKAAFEELAKIPGVRRLAWAVEGTLMCASTEGASDPEAEAALASFASELKPHVATAAKRLGAGAVQEVELVSVDGCIAGFAGAAGFLAAELEPHRRSEAVNGVLREFVARYDSVRRRSAAAP